ncbi:MAG TPA: SPFH domain-containing protein [Phycisphaerae bacterium]|nr:SPFH domain-containing protein [Phycisphaerae bacterium]
MRRAETLAWAALAGLLAIAAILLAGGIKYDTTPFWAGMMMALGQALVVGLAGYGLRLARQAEELEDAPVSTRGGPRDGLGIGFRMSMGDDRGGETVGTSTESEVKTIDTGFQRLLVIITAIVLVSLSVVISWSLIWNTISWAGANPDKPFPIAGSFDKPVAVDELGLVIGLGAAVLYAILYWVTRITRQTVGYGEAVNSNFTIGITGMIAVGAATVLAYLRMTYAAEIAGGIVAFLLLLQGLELFVNGLRTYSAIDELDQEAIDLQALPLVPMLSSFWLNGLKMIFAQSVGLAGSTEERGVIARMMPRAIVAVIVIGLAADCFRVVRPGEVAVLERLGSADIVKQADGKVTLGADSLLQPGLHITFPWPIDNLFRIPTGALQDAHVGVELHELPGMDKIPFEFWTAGPEPTTEQQVQTQFVTGDTGSPQLLETYVAILWRVGDPAKFYTHLSHSDFFEKSSEGTQALPVYDELVRQCAYFAVTRAMATHSLDNIMLNGRLEVEQHCQRVLQDKLDAVDSGIVIEDLTIKDLHPPRGHDVADATAPDGRRLGPASQFEDVVSQREFADMRRNQAMGIQVTSTTLAQGDAASAISEAEGYQADRIGTAEAEAGQMTSMLGGMQALEPDKRDLLEKLAKIQTKYRSLQDVLAPVNKVVLDRRVGDVQLYQTGNNPFVPRPPGQ